MSDQVRVKNALDQENSHKLAPAKGTNQNNNENSLENHKKRVLAPSGPLPKRVRVPLAGKDQNAGIPSLLRSKSSVAPAATPESRLRRPLSAGLAFQPGLTKSNSSLGFTHVPASTPPQSSANQSDPHKNTLLAPEGAHRLLELVPRFATDSLRKTDQQPLPPLGTTLKDTLSDRTHALHASFVTSSTVRPGDPTKKLDNRNELLEQLAESDVEHVTHQDVPEQPHVPLGAAALRDDDLKFLRTGIRRVSTSESVMDLSFESTWDGNDSADAATAAQNAQLQSELGAPVGLSTDELALLLEW